MIHNMIRYNKTSAGIKWMVIRKGKMISMGLNSTIQASRILAEQSVIDAYKAEKIQTKVLMGIGDNQLSLLVTNK